MCSRSAAPGVADGASTTCSPPAETGSTGTARSNNPSASPTGMESKEAQTLPSKGITSDVYDSRIRAAVEMRSNASRSEMSRACSDTRRSRGELHVGRDDREVLDEEHDCAGIAGAVISSAATNTMLRAGCRSCPIENRDVPLSLDSSTERESNDIEHSVNWLTGKRCGQVKIRQR